MRTSRFLAPGLAAATLLLLGANALPTIHRRHRLERERAVLREELRIERRRHETLRTTVHALRHDRFYLQRVLAETWNGVPAGAVAFRPEKKLD